VDSHALMGALMAEAEDAGCTFAFRTQVLGGKLEPGRPIVVATDQVMNNEMSPVCTSRPSDQTPGLLMKLST
jgi:hypothetical protein